MTMHISWNEARARAAKFAEEWKDETYERGETQTFYNEFFEIFGVRRRRVASFEEAVKKLGDKRGFIDLFWKGVLLVEQKSAGRDLVKAKQQALDYFPGLKEYELPRYILLKFTGSCLHCRMANSGGMVGMITSGRSGQAALGSAGARLLVRRAAPRLHFRQPAYPLEPAMLASPGAGPEGWRHDGFS